MKVWLTPEIFNSVALTAISYRWKLLAWSLGGFILFYLLQTQVGTQTPAILIWLTIFILFSALQALVFSAFIFFFQELASNKVQDKIWIRFYRIIEWCETILFGFILPLPTLLFIYALIVI
ncbi:hypothetical protein [Thalassotalea sp. G2M2-11]|uniref:hypothetical protein n=1 Tax=Thalassotalea sp. G2M2-11 TaxID=2787627 RepID=UPI0019D1714F|nr:hypothetical protein [Thalassotalea sp. G2M2-11]